MRILCVIDNLGSGGAQRQMAYLACGLKESGHEVECFTYHAGEFFKPVLLESGVAVHCIQKPSRYSLQPVVALRRFVREHRIEVVIAFLETPSVYAELACIFQDGVRLIVSERNHIPHKSAGRTAKAFLHRLADTVVTNSHAQRRWLCETFPHLGRKTTTVWNGVDLGAFLPQQARPASGTLRLVGIGRISPQKNLHSLLEALAECRTRAIDVTIDWAGETDNAAYLADLRGRIEALGLDAAWRWLGLIADVPALLGKYDALVLPSKWEGLPNVVCEALAAGCPVLASKVSDNELLVESGKRGYLFDSTGPADIASEMAKFAATPAARRNEMGRAARAFAAERLSLEAYVGSYNRLVARPADAWEHSAV